MSFSLVISSSKPKSGAGACSTGAVETRCVCDENSGGWETKKREELRFLKGDVCVGEEMEKGKEGEERVWEDNKEARRCAGVRAVAIFRRKRTQVKQLFREGLRKRITPNWWGSEPRSSVLGGVTKRALLEKDTTHEENGLRWKRALWNCLDKQYDNYCLI
jgi:hypothetical protein